MSARIVYSNNAGFMRVWGIFMKLIYRMDFGYEEISYKQTLFLAFLC